jgi:hypothetical protein
MRSSESV